MEDDLRTLRFAIESGFATLTQRVTDQERTQAERHQENLTRLDAINGKVNRAHERIATHDGLLEALRARVEGVAKNLHDRFGEIQKTLLRRYLQTRQHANGEADPVTWTKLRWWIAVGAGSIVGTWWAMQNLFGFHR